MIFVTWAKKGAFAFEALISALHYKSIYPKNSKVILYWLLSEGENADSIEEELLENFHNINAEIHFIENHSSWAKMPRLIPYLGLSHSENEPFFACQPDVLLQSAFKGDVKIEFSRQKKKKHSWPVERLYGPTRCEIWKDMCASFDVDCNALKVTNRHSSDPLYWATSDANWVAGANARQFGKELSSLKHTIENNRPDILICEELPEIAHVLYPTLTALKLGYKAFDTQSEAHAHSMGYLAYFYATAPDNDIERFEELLSPNRVKRCLKKWDAANF